MAQAFYLSATRFRRSPLYMPHRDFVIGQGDDFKIAATIYNRDTDTAPIDVSGSLSQIAVWPLDRHWRAPWADYWAGLIIGLAGQPGIPYIAQAGFVWDGPNGRINAQLTAAQTICMYGRFAVALQVDFGDGVQTVLRGMLSIDRSAGMIATPRSFFTLDQSVLDGPDLLAPNVDANGNPVDSDGFPI